MTSPNRNRRQAAAALSLLLAACFLAVTTRCATTKAGEDPVLVKAQQTYDTVLEACNTLFVIEKQDYRTSKLIETKIPGAHAKIDALRVRAADSIPALRHAINLYTKDKVGGAQPLQIALDLVNQLLTDVQTAATQVTGVPVLTPTPVAWFRTNEGEVFA